MVTDDVKELLRTLNDRVTEELESAVGFAVNRGHYEVTLEHLLLKLLDRDDTDLVCIFDHFGVDRYEVEKGLLHDVEGMRRGNSGRPSFSPPLLQLVESALLIGSVHHDLASVGRVSSGIRIGSPRRTSGRLLRDRRGLVGIGLLDQRPGAVPRSGRVLGGRRRPRSVCRQLYGASP